ncbi:MAG: hypothetical protein MJ085_05180 [Clostridia bacterium]|nr:hypothetical protein [Clostridia bacterium]
MINDKIRSKIDALPDEKKEKLKDCTTKRELLDRIAESGMELADEELEAVSGGYCCSDCQRHDTGGPRENICNSYWFPEDCSYDCISFMDPATHECHHCDYICTSHYIPGL